MQTNRTTEYSITYANGFSMMMSDHDFKISFGTSDLANTETVVENFGVFMTHKTLKLLAKSLSLVVENFERDTGKEIELDEGKLSVFNQDQNNLPISPPA